MPQTPPGTVEIQYQGREEVTAALCALPNWLENDAEETGKSFDFTGPLIIDDAAGAVGRHTSIIRGVWLDPADLSRGVTIEHTFVTSSSVSPLERRHTVTRHEFEMRRLV